MGFISKWLDDRVRQLLEINEKLEDRIVDLQDAVRERDRREAKLNSEIRRLNALIHTHEQNYSQLQHQLEVVQYKYLQMLNQSMRLAAIHEDILLRPRELTDKTEDA